MAMFSGNKETKEINEEMIQKNGEALESQTNVEEVTKVKKKFEFKKIGKKVLIGVGAAAVAVGAFAAGVATGHKKSASSEPAEPIDDTVDEDIEITEF